MTDPDVTTEQLHAWADELQELAHNIAAAIETLPANASKGTRELFEQHARRALALAAAHRVEASAPSTEVVGLLSRMRVVVVSAVAAAATTVGIGFTEESGAELWAVVRDSAAAILSDGDEPHGETERDEGLPPPNGPPDGDEPHGETERDEGLPPPNGPPDNLIQVLGRPPAAPLPRPRGRRTLNVRVGRRRAEDGGIPWRPWRRKDS